MPLLCGRLSLLLAASAALGAESQHDVRFLVLGDFGEHGDDEQTPVAVSMGRVASSFKPDFVLSTGCARVQACSAAHILPPHPPPPLTPVLLCRDNVYSHGIASTSDPLWKRNFNDVYTDPSLDVPWLGSMGNHDYGDDGKCVLEGTCGNVTAQWDGAALGFPRWRADMSFRDASDPRAVTHHGDGMLDVFYLDTRPYDRNTDEMVMNGFLPAQVAADPEALDLWWTAWADGQVARLETQLASSQARWKIVSGHYPVYSYGAAHGSTRAMRPLNTVMRRAGVAAYINGHDHVLTVIRIPSFDESGPLYVTSGGGSSPYNDISDPEDGSLLFGHGLAGFHSVEVTSDKLTLTTLDIGGNELHTLVKAYVSPPTDCHDPRSADWRCKTPVPPATPGGSGGYGPCR